jgi:putative phosphoribosyl transferase
VAFSSVSTITSPVAIPARAVADLLGDRLRRCPGKVRSALALTDRARFDSCRGAARRRPPVTNGGSAVDHGVFDDRTEAGRRLAAALGHLRGEPLVVIGLPRGGVPVAAEVAAALEAPLDVIVVRKLGTPGHTELGLGAIGEDGVRVIDDAIVATTRTSAAQVAQIEAAERVELDHRVRRLRAVRPRVDLHGKTVVIVDDGIATGGTARAACRTARARGAARIVLAVPVAPGDWRHRLDDDADEFVALHTSDRFRAVGHFYRDFAPVSDDTVVACLEAAARPDGTPRPKLPAALDVHVEVPVANTRLGGQLTVPAGAVGLVVFAHGSGSSRHSPRNRFVAARLNEAGLATLLVDLLTPHEEQDRSNVFDVALLSDRLCAATGWVREQFRPEDLPICYFGASTGAAAALHASTRSGTDIAAIVSRGGRPDLAGVELRSVTVPTLLIVGGRDRDVLELNRRAQAELRCESRITIVPGATHLFEERGALEAVADLATDWFIEHLSGRTGDALRSHGSVGEP